MTSDPKDMGRSAPNDGDPWRPVQAPPPPVPPDRVVPRREPPTRPPLAVPLAPTAPRPPAGGPFRAGPRRADDRRIVAASIAIAAGFLVLALVAALAAGAGAAVLSPWLPLHLALAGGASTAIAGVMPFFVAALAAGAPTPGRLRGGAVALVAAGAALVAVRGVAPGAPALTLAPVLGGTVYLLGIGAVALAVRASGRAGLMVRRPIVSIGYTLALVNVGLGGLLGTLSVAGWAPVVEAWARLRPAHAWTNLVGFVSLVIIATLVHFLPTVLGGRILPRRSSILAVLGTALGVPVVVAGLVVGWMALAGGGAVLVLVGAGALALDVGRNVRDRGTWTSDPGWHRFASVGLLAGVAWYLVGVTVATLLVLRESATGGSGAGAWSTPAVGAPLLAGWAAQVLAASWTHLLPSIGPGGPVEHARQRAILGRLATPRLAALNAGAGLLWIGWSGAAAWPFAAPLGAGLAGAAILASVVIASRAVRVRPATA